MGRTWVVSAVLAMAVTFCASCLLAGEPAKAPDDAKLQKVRDAMPDKAIVPPAKPRKLLVFNLCKGFKHGSIPLGTETLRIMGEKTGAFTIESSDDPAVFKAESLAKFDAVMMNNTTGALFEDEDLKASLMAFVRGGKGIAGLHAATDCGAWKWPEYREMMGGVFAGHPFSRISVKLDDPQHPLNAAFEGKGFEITDEIYTFKESYSREALRVIQSIDWENANITKAGTRQDNDYALAWVRSWGNGRVFYSAFGHQDPIFWNPAILKHWLAGIQFVMGDLKADTTPIAKVKVEPARGPVLGEKKAQAAAPEVRVFAAPAAKNDGWTVLFDGTNLDAWQEPASKKWAVADGVLARQQGSGNIWTKEKYGDFILSLEFKAANAVKGPDGKDASPSTNSGVFLRSPEGEKNWLQGSIEIQVSNSYGPDRKPGKHDVGSVYDASAPTVAAEKPVGEWNQMVIMFKGNKLDIELNGKKIIDINLDDWKEAGMNPDGSKNKFKTAYKDMPKVGHIGLQDHGQPVWYRNVKIKPLN